MEQIDPCEWVCNHLEKREGVQQVRPQMLDGFLSGFHVSVNAHCDIPECQIFEAAVLKLIRRLGVNVVNTQAHGNARAHEWSARGLQIQKAT